MKPVALAARDLPVVPEAGSHAGDARIHAVIDAHYDFVWRSLRRLGVRTADLDDGVQRVFLVAARKLGPVRPEGERPFLYQTTLRVAADVRRGYARRREVLVPEPAEEVDPAPLPDELLELRRSREALDRMLAGMPLDLRAVFTLFELDQMTLTEIAELLGVPRGTVASRLRRAREAFDEASRAVLGRGVTEVAT